MVVILNVEMSPYSEKVMFFGRSEVFVVNGLVVDSVHWYSQSNFEQPNSHFSPSC